MASAGDEDKGAWSNAIEYCRHNKLKAFGTIWGTSLVLSLAYQWTRPIPTSLRIIHSRVYAQGLALAGIAGFGVIDYLEHRDTTKSELEKAKAKLMELESKVEGKLFGNGKK